MYHTYAWYLQKKASDILESLIVVSPRTGAGNRTQVFLKSKSYLSSSRNITFKKIFF